MRQILPFISGVLTIGAVIPYLLDIAKGSTKPNAVTWFTWTLLSAINSAAAYSDGAWQTAIFSGSAAIATGTIFVMSLKKGVKKYTTFDIACQVVALLGIPLWLLTGQPTLAVLILMCVDFAGGLPTLRHAWAKPHEETWQTFAISILAGALTLASLQRYDIVALAMPLYIFLFDSSLMLAIFYRRRKLAPKS